MEKLDEWDNDFLEEVIQLEEAIIANSSARFPTNTTTTTTTTTTTHHHPLPTTHLPYHHHHHHHHHRPSPTVESFSPPRVFTQNFSSTYTANRNVPNPPNLNLNLPTNFQLIDDQVSINHNATTNVQPQQHKEQETEISRLKRELERASHQLSQLQRECSELKKDRDQKEEQLKSVSAHIDAQDDEAVTRFLANEHDGNRHVNQIGYKGKQHEDVTTTRSSLWTPEIQNPSTSNHQAVPEYPSCGTKGTQRTSGSRGAISQRLLHNSTSALGGTDDPVLNHELRENCLSVRRNIQCDGISATLDHKCRIVIDNDLMTSNECSYQETVLPETSAHPKFFKAIGVQTERSDDYTHLTTETSMHSRRDLLNELQAIWASPSSQRSGRNLVSKLFMTCSADFYDLFKCMGMSMPSNVTPNALSNKNFSDVVMHNKTQYVHSVEATKVGHLYFILTKVNNDLIQLEILVDALLDLCALENVVVVHRSLHILHVILQYILSSERRSNQRDNVMVEGISPKGNSISLFEKLQTGVESGATTNLSSIHGDVSSSLKSFNFETLGDRKYGCNSNVGNDSSLDCVSLFEKIHHIAMGNKEDCILVEAISVLNLILMRTNPYSEREKFGQILLFETIARLLQKDVGLHVQKQALRLLFLLLNCPKLSVAFCSGCNNDTSADDNTEASTSQVFGHIMEGLTECVKCKGHSAQELKLRRLAIIVLAFIASSGKSGFEVILNRRLSESVNFLELIIQTLASEMDAEAAEPAELTEICTERSSLMREALILLNRLASNPTYSVAVLRSLTSSRDMASLTIDVANGMSRKGKGWLKPDRARKRKTDDEIVDLARVFRSRVFAYLGENIS